MARSTVHYADNDTNRILKKLHNKLRPAGTPVQRVEYIIELLLLRIFEVKLKQEEEFKQLRNLFVGDDEKKLFSFLLSVSNEQLLSQLNQNIFPFYSKIISLTRKVYKGNFPPKVQDQLVLIEEVFSNSNFTNNVTSGNLAEIISLVQEIDESRLLKTDLLGDAIESSLSESGGTKDIGLYRTPDHIRQFMVGLVNPGFNDIIFDPACGTGGFLFDTFEFVMQRVKASYNEFDKWPGTKSHPELHAWFNNYFIKNPLPFPSEDIAHKFYRSGISGFEYLGMVRKMAAINFYIRGLNPHNIQQGDSLAKFNPVEDGESKSIVIANPPFGAERDQEAYPEVWAEYSRESETTILFVKLMFEHLKKGGTCATIVSEGFHSWDQFSAKALRKMLLDEADLKAIISLPQGVFVSKNGQGPKTSILLFEKGKTTENVWFFKVTNDGYTMGTNRKQTTGCQLVECLDLYYNYIKQDKQPPASKHSFLIPAKWIKALDPRIKVKIKKETREELALKGKEQKTKLEEDLKKKLEAGKIDKQEISRQLLQFDEILESKIENEIASRIEKAHTYSFNLSNYRSNLTEDELKTWKDIVDGIDRNTNLSLDEIYFHLTHDRKDEAIKYLSLLNPKNYLELDIAREFIFNLGDDSLLENYHLNQIKELLKRDRKYPFVKLKDYIILNDNKIKPANFSDVNWKVLGVSNEVGIFLNENLNPEETAQSYFLVKKNQFCYNPYRINVGSIGLNEFDYDNQIISGAYLVFGTKEDELNPKYLNFLFKSKFFLDYVNEKANGGVRMNFKFEDMENWEIPLPSIEEQQEIVERLDKQNTIIDNIENLSSKLSLANDDIKEVQSTRLSDVADIFMGQSPPGDTYNDKGEGLPLINGPTEFGKENDASPLKIKFTTTPTKICQEKDLLVCVRGATTGRMNIASFPACIGRGAAIIRAKTDQKYLNYYLIGKSKDILNIAAGAMFPNLSSEQLNNFRISYPSQLEREKFIEYYERQKKIISELKFIETSSRERIKTIYKEIWGGEQL